jgi:hypothetical protein
LCLSSFALFAVSLAEADREAAAASGFCWACWRVALAGDQEVAGAEGDLAADPEAGPAEADLAVLAAGAAEAEAPPEVGKVEREERG